MHPKLQNYSVKANINIKYGMWANRKYLVYYTDTLLVFVANYLWSQGAGTNINKQNPYYLENHTVSHIHKYYKKCEIFHFQLQSSNRQWLLYNLMYVLDYLQPFSLTLCFSYTHTEHRQTPHYVDVTMIAQTHTIFRNKQYLLNVVLPRCSHRTLCDTGLLGVFRQV